MFSGHIDSRRPILVAESDPQGEAALKRVFEEFQFSDVTYLDDGNKALHSGRFHDFSLLVISHSLEGVDGLRLLSSLRAEGKNREIPMIFLHDAGEEEVARKARDAGAAGTLPKPVEEEALRELVEKLLGGRILTVAEHQKMAQRTLVAVQRGRACLEEGNLLAAQEAFIQAMETGAGETEVYCGLAEVFMAKGEPKAAEEVLEEASRLDPLAKDKFRVHEPNFLRRGDDKLAKGRFEAAMHEFRGAIAANENSVAGHAGLSESLQALGDEEGANQAFEVALSIDQRPKDLHVYNRMGIAARKKKEYEQALRSYERAISFDSEDPVLHYNKSMVFLAQRNFDESLALLGKALELDPEFTEAGEAQRKIAAMRETARETQDAEPPAG